MAVAGGIAGAVSASLGSGSGESENIPKKVNNFVCQILPKLHKNSIAKREMKLCEAYCLLWHHRSHGTVNGRRTSDKLISCAYAAVILDLWASGKIDIELRGKLTDECVEAVIKVRDATKTGSFLDAAGFSEMVAVHERGKMRELKNWIEYCVRGDPDKNCVSVVLDYFVKKGIIGKESKWFGMTRTYPTRDKEPQIQLLLEVRRITLRDEVPDGFMSALLTILRFADTLHNSEDPLLGRYYNESEYAKAEPRLDKILRNSGINAL